MRIALESSVVLLVLLTGCRPTEISEARFQSRAQTCYPVPVLDDAGVQQLNDAGRPIEEIPEGCEGASQPVPPPGAGIGSGAVMGLLPLRPAGNGTGSSTGATVHSGDAGVAGGADEGVVSEPNPEGDPAAVGPLEPVCDATQIFSKPAEMGGCADITGPGGCHESGATGVIPDLLSPGVATRLLGGSSKLVATADAKGNDCAFVPASMRTWIAPGYDESGSFLWNKITSDETSVLCGKPMPDDEPSLSEESKACIRKWIEWVAAGGR